MGSISRYHWLTTCWAESPVDEGKGDEYERRGEQRPFGAGPDAPLGEQPDQQDGREPGERFDGAADDGGPRECEVGTLPGEPLAQCSAQLAERAEPRHHGEPRGRRESRALLPHQRGEPDRDKLQRHPDRVSPFACPHQHADIDRGRGDPDAEPHFREPPEVPPLAA